MDFESAWKEVISRTEIIRMRIRQLNIQTGTDVPYIMLSESDINVGDTVVRSGEVHIERPMLVVPPNHPQFDGFDFNELEQGLDENALINFLIVRGVSLPSMKFNNQTYKLDLFEGDLSKAVKHYESELNRNENVRSGLLIGHPEYWQLSLLMFVCSQILRDAPNDIRRLMNDHRKNNP